MRTRETLMCGLVLAAALSPVARGDGDQQIWVNASSGAKVTDALRLSIEEESRVRNDWDEYYEQHVLPMATYRLAKWCSVGLGMREVFARKNQPIYTPATRDGETVYSPAGAGDRYWQREDRPTAELVFRKEVGAWTLEDRARVEYRCKEGQDEYVRYRNRIKVKSPWKWTALGVNPYAMWEANYSDGRQNPDWDRHRFYGGFDSQWRPNLKAGLYYGLQQDLKDDEWTDTYVTGVVLQFGS